jgi:hypothetical protein
VSFDLNIVFWLGLLKNILSVYVQYKNVKLMAIGIKLKNVTSDMNFELDVSTHSHCLTVWY